MKSKKEKRLMEDMDKYSICHQCNGTGKIWLGRHWYTIGYQVKCTYCDGLGTLAWATKKQ